MNADSESGEANIAVMGMVKRIVLDGSCILPIFQSMRDAKIAPLANTEKRRKVW